MFEPIAIIGQACLLPGANSKEALWQNVLAGKDCLIDATPTLWDIDPDAMLNQTVDGTWSKRCGTVEDFASIFDPTGFLLPAEFILKLDVLHQWLFHAGREALSGAGISLEKLRGFRSGAIIGNLSYPTQSFVQYAESVWLKDEGFVSPHLREVAAENRFMSGLPIFRLAEALGLNTLSYAIDAACASSIYAIKLACDQLQSHQADIMIAGGINAADSLFLQMGFSALRALSKSGQALSLHQDADGLVPSQGTALVVLKRLEDAIKAEDPILGVLRGIGLSNDGRGSGLLVPHGAGQIAAMRQAYEVSGLSPDEVEWVECHATGTPLGDSTEIRSMQHIFNGVKRPALGVLKANIGHTITASGAAALINVLSAFAHHVKPKTRLSCEKPMALLEECGFKLLNAPEDWTSTDRPHLAAVNCFGFGGNNAHLLVEEWRPASPEYYFTKSSAPKQSTRSAIAIVGTGILAGDALNQSAWLTSMRGPDRSNQPDRGRLSNIDLAIDEAPFPPRDLQHTLGQQLAIIKAAHEAIAGVNKSNPDRTAVYIGMQCDAEIARSGLRWRLGHLLPEITDPAWLQEARDLVQAPVESADIIGCMPNIVANRLNNIFDFKAPSFSVSAEELSGVVALELAIEQLQKNAIDMAVIGAVDLSTERVHEEAAKNLFGSDHKVSGDAAVVLVLKRLQDARKDGDRIMSIIPACPPNGAQVEWSSENNLVTQQFGHAHAAAGLLQVALANLFCSEQTENIKLNLTSFKAPQKTIYVQKNRAPKLVVFSGETKEDVLNALRAGRSGETKGRAKLVLVAHHAEELAHQKEWALLQLQGEKNAELPGIFYFDQPIQGQLAFVFTGALTSYANMGQELIQTWPELIDQLQTEVSVLPEITEQIYHMQGNSASLSLLDELKTYSFLTQLHARFSQTILNLTPDACIGYCSGETNALIAMRAWRDMEQLFLDVDKAGLYSKQLAGDYQVLAENGKEAKWSTWRLFSPVETVKELIEASEGVRLTIINSHSDCIIAGHPKDCEKFLTQLNSPRAKELPHSLLIHCPEFAPYANEWERIHSRETYQVPGVRFYSAGSGQGYYADAKNTKDALLSQAARTVNFPRVVQQAWVDGARFFVELGPRDICSQWIQDILADKPHFTISFDKMGTSSLTQAVYVIGKLLAAGFTRFNYDAFLLKDGTW